MYKKFIHRIIFIFLLTVFFFATSFSCFAEIKTFSFGGKEPWHKPQKSERVIIKEGYNGKENLMLSTNSIYKKDSVIDSKTELLLTFDQFPFFDLTSSYTVEFRGMEATKKHETFMGTGSGKNVRDSKGIALHGNENSFFGSRGMKGSFTIDFWLYSIIAENGEQIFSWKTSKQEKKKLVSQFIRGAIFNNRIEWTFHNFFESPSQSAKSATVAESSFTLQSQGILIPGKWSHHTIAFDEETGLLEYRVDGRTEATTYVTDNKRETGNVFHPVIGYPAPIELCSKFSGNIDEFRIQNEFVAEDYLDKYSTQGGKYISQPIKTFSSSSFLKNVEVTSYIPKETGIAIFARGGDDIYSWSDDSPKWIAINSKTDFSKIQGEYFQIQAELYSDGNGEQSPEIQEIKVSWQEKDAPWPPSKVFTKSEDGKITLSWTNSADFQTTGYLVYYGERSGEYFGKQAVEGYSPIDVGNKNEITISGLTNGKIYYFAVAAYDKSKTTEVSSLSQEVYARPMRN